MLTGGREPNGSWSQCTGGHIGRRVHDTQLNVDHSVAQDLDALGSLYKRLSSEVGGSCMAPPATAFAEECKMSSSLAERSPMHAMDVPNMPCMSELDLEEWL